MGYKRLRALLVNPSIYDFAAYSYWSSPMGLSYMGSILRKNGVDIDLVDCTRVVEAKRKGDGRAPFVKESVPSPPALQGIRKRFKRYGISREALTAELSLLKTPDLVLVTSIMTYWYPGVIEALQAVKEVFPSSRVVIGGVYPSLCFSHASRVLYDADLVVKNSEVDKFYAFFESAFGKTLRFKPSPLDLDSMPYPCYDLFGAIPFVPLLTSFGCLYRCAYCATPYMYPTIVRRRPSSVIEEIRHWHGLGVTRHVLYDDNFLYRSDLYAKPLLKGIAELPFAVDFYNPNALNAALIDHDVAVLLKEAGFKEVRLGFESADPFIQRSTGGKINLDGFEKSVEVLRGAGFANKEIVAYVLAGLPQQRWQDVKHSIDYAVSLGIEPSIAEYTPIPHTPLFAKYHHTARFPISKEPLYQNNALFPFAWEGFTEQDLEYLKLYARDKKVVPKNPFAA